MHASDRYLEPGATLDDLRQADGTIGYSPKLRHGVTGKGLNDYDAIFRILAEHNYRGWVSIEDGMNGMDEMAESLAFLRRKSTAKYFPGGSDRETGRGRDWSGAGRSATIHAAALRVAARGGVRRRPATRPGPRGRVRREVRRAAFVPDVPTMLREAGSRRSSIGTPHPLHARAGHPAAEAGVHVLVEKPMAAIARRLRRDARRGAQVRRHARRHQPAAVLRAGSSG